MIDRKHSSAPTPRTDEAERAARDEYDIHREAGWPAFDHDGGYDFARQMEREVAMLREAVALLKEGSELYPPSDRLIAAAMLKVADIALSAKYA